jgi:hypothetical protein
MRSAWNGIALLVLSHLAFANVSSALAQAGSIGGSIGKQDKSISGSEEADRPRAVPHPKRPAAAIDINGVWGSNIGSDYQITQTGNTFRWVVVHGAQRETATGTMDGSNVSASWSGTNGSGSASGVIVVVGGLKKIEWSNGAVFLKR